MFSRHQSVFWNIVWFTILKPLDQGYLLVKVEKLGFSMLTSVFHTFSTRMSLWSNMKTSSSFEYTFYTDEHIVIRWNISLYMYLCSVRLEHTQIGRTKVVRRALMDIFIHIFKSKYFSFWIRIIFNLPSFSKWYFNSLCVFLC